MPFARRRGSTADWASALEHAQQLADKAAHTDQEAALRSIQGLPKDTADHDPRRVRLNRQRDQAAGDLSNAKSALQHARDVRDDAAKQAAKVIHRAITHDGMHDSGWDKLGDTVDSIASDVGDFLKDAGEVLVSDLASLGNAMLHDTGSTLSVLGGLALVVGGLGEEAGIPEQERRRGTKPDFRIEGQIFDNYAPTASSPRSIWSAVEKKVDKGQTERVVLNLGDSNADLGALQKQCHDWPKAGLKEVLVIDRAGNVVHLYP
ncbi:CdiA C-terminal domain-containing protein [Streptomyces sp. NPDC054813]